MTLKQINQTFGILCLAILFGACAKQSNFTIKGKLDGGAGKTLYFARIALNTQTPIDSIKLDGQGEFQFDGHTSSPAFFILELSANSYVTLLIDSTEQVSIQGSYKNFTRDYRVSGSVGSEVLRDLDNRFVKAKKSIDSLKNLCQKHQIDPTYTSQVTQWNAQITSIATDHSNYVTGYIKRNPFSLASVYALYQRWDDQSFVVNDILAMKTAASALYSVYPKNDQVIALYNNTMDLVKAEKNKKLNAVIQSSAVNSPNISLPDVDGHLRDLWSLHGKFVLLHFWSAKDRASRILNPVLSELYHKYKSKGLEIYMVSVDTDRAAWLEAIASDNLSCINVGDMKGSYQAVTNYNVQELPFNYLLDKEGNIIGRDLKGPTLDQVMQKILK